MATGKVGFFVFFFENETDLNIYVGRVDSAAGRAGMSESET